MTTTPIIIINNNTNIIQFVGDASNNLAAKLERFLKDNGIEVNLINATPEVQEPGPFVPFDIPQVEGHFDWDNGTIERIRQKFSQKFDMNQNKAAPEEEPGTVVIEEAPVEANFANDTNDTCGTEEGDVEAKAEVEGFVDVDQDLNEEGYAIVNAP